MSKTLVQLTKDDENYTPKWFVDKFGSFDYDPATVEAKAVELGIENYDTILTDGLTKDWTQYKRIWINPPFTKKKEFLTKARETYQQKKIDIYIVSYWFYDDKELSRSDGRYSRMSLYTRWSHQFPKWTRKKAELSNLWKCCIKAPGFVGG